MTQAFPESLPSNAYNPSIFLKIEIKKVMKKLINPLFASL